MTDFKTSRARWSQEHADQVGEPLLLYSKLVKHFVPANPRAEEILHACRKDNT